MTSLREFTVLNRLGEVLNGAADVADALRDVLPLVSDLVGLRTAWLWLLDPETGRFYSAAVLNLPPYLTAPVRMTGTPCWCMEAFTRGELTPRHVDVMACSRLRPAVRARQRRLTEGLAWHASVPLIFRDEPLGILNVAGGAGQEPDAHRLELLTLVAYQVSTAIARSRAAEAATRTARAEERAALARDIHDTLAQGLTAIVLHVESALKSLDGHPDRARPRLEVALVTARNSLEQARGSVVSLRAGALHGQPLAEAIRRLSRTFTSRTGVRVQVQADVEVSLPLRIESELYHVAGEALANVERHARATEVRIALSVSGDTLKLVVADDGAGFDTRVPHPQRHGLLGMRERVRLLGGRLRVSSRPGHGTRVSVQVPL